MANHQLPSSRMKPGFLLSMAVVSLSLIGCDSGGKAKAPSETSTSSAPSQAQNPGEKKGADAGKESGSASDSESPGDDENKEKPRSDSKDNESEEDSESPEEKPTFGIVGNRGQGSGCQVGKANDTEIMVTNSTPGGPVDYAQWVFDRLVLDEPGNGDSIDCSLELDLEWTPGYRIRVDVTEWDGFTEHMPPDAENNEGEPKEEDADPTKPRKPTNPASLLNAYWRRTTFGFAGHTPTVQLEMSDEELLADQKFQTGKGQWSDCSGKGRWTTKLELGVSKNTKSDFRLTVDFFMVTFGGLEKCPEGAR